MKNKKKKGFTLVELIVVIAIIAILAAVAVPLTMDYLNKAEKTATADEIKLIKDNLAVVSTDINGATTTINKKAVVDLVKSHISQPEHIDKLTLYVKADGTIVADIYGNKYYEAEPANDAEHDAIKGYTVGKVALSVFEKKTGTGTLDKDITASDSDSDSNTIKVIVDGKWNDTYTDVKSDLT